MRIVIISQYYSEGMGYTENLLPKALAALGHEVHVVASTLQVYGNHAGYKESYESFLGAAERTPGSSHIDGYKLHRLAYYTRGRYVGLRGLGRFLGHLRPEVVQFIQIAGLDALTLLPRLVRSEWATFTECHQHASIAWRPEGSAVRRILGQFWYRTTRTLPAWLVHRRVERCFAIAPDCVQVAVEMYGVPREKIVLLPLGTDTELFHPCNTGPEAAARERVRIGLSVGPDEILTIYTGRFSTDKNPLLLARAVELLRRAGRPVKAIFVGSGVQENEIKSIPGCTVLGFKKHIELAEIYRAADLGVWPSQESMSMLDAAASGLPLLVSNRMGEQDRILGNGATYREGDVNSLAEAVWSHNDSNLRRKMARVGRDKMLCSYSWKVHADARIAYYMNALAERGKGRTSQ